MFGPARTTVMAIISMHAMSMRMQSCITTVGAEQ
jgi:hypothetical protein